jgi:hypothetical protein
MTLEEALKEIEVLKKQLELYKYAYGQLVKQQRQYIQIED